MRGLQERPRAFLVIPEPLTVTESAPRGGVQRASRGKLPMATEVWQTLILRSRHWGPPVRSLSVAQCRSASFPGWATGMQKGHPQTAEQGCLTHSPPHPCTLPLCPCVCSILPLFREMGQRFGSIQGKTLQQHCGVVEEGVRQQSRIISSLLPYSSPPSLSLPSC